MRLPWRSRRGAQPRLEKAEKAQYRLGSRRTVSASQRKNTIRLHDKPLVVLSENSVSSTWVEREVQAASPKSGWDCIPAAAVRNASTSGRPRPGARNRSRRERFRRRHRGTIRIRQPGTSRRRTGRVCQEFCVNGLVLFLGMGAI